MMAARDHYQTLGVPPDATPDQVRDAYRFKVFAHHPDRFGGAPEIMRRQAEEELKAINEAFAVLNDPRRRAAYDRSLGTVTPTPPSSDREPPAGGSPAGMPRLLRWTVPILAILYVLSPIDLIPDAIPLAGRLDDLLVALIAAYLMYVGAIG